MIAPQPPDEAGRLDALRAFAVLDTPPEREYDDLARLAASVCGTPVALVSLVDDCRQWFKARVGLDAAETPRDVAFCSHAILGDDLLVVPDAAADGRFRDNPLVTGGPHIRFYAGAPLTTPEGHAVGTLCVIDRVPRDLTAGQRDALRVLARQVVAHLLLRRQVGTLAAEVARRRELEAELRATEGRFRAFMDHSPAVAWVKDEAGRYVYLSARFEERFLVTLDRVRGKTDFDLWPEELARQFRENDLQVLRTGRDLVTVERAAGPSGAVSHWWTVKFPFADRAGVRYVGGVAVDISDRERLADELRRKNGELEEALDKVRRLGSLVTMCAWTRTIRMGDRWVSVEEFLRERLGVRVSHGISDEALLRVEEELRELRGGEAG